jgi:hypothetical protein
MRGTFSCSEFRGEILWRIASSFSMASALCVSEKRVAFYHLVSFQPPNSWMVLSPTPAIASLDANVCRKAWGVTSGSLACWQAVVNAVRILRILLSCFSGNETFCE